MRTHWIKPSEITAVWELNNREKNEDYIESLTVSMQEHGYKAEYPLIVFEAIHIPAIPCDTPYLLAGGHHRWVAAQQAGIERVFAEIHEDDEDDFIEVMSTDNQQFDASQPGIGLAFTEKERRVACKQLMFLPKYLEQTNVALAEMWRVTEGTVRNWRQDVVERIATGKTGDLYISDSRLERLRAIIASNVRKDTTGKTVKVKFSSKKKKSWDPDTEQAYEIELPAPEVVQQVILELDYPPDGLMLKQIADEVASWFDLSDDEKYARNESQVRRGTKDTIWRDQMIFPAVQKLLKEGKLEQPEGSHTPYFLAENAPLPPAAAKSNLNLDLDPVPEESIDKSYQQIREKLVKELLQKIKDSTPRFFEELVIDLLVKMGYGGSREDAGKAVGGSGDGGIDGIINQDKLGFDVMYVQAKRWENNVGSPEIAGFVGALARQSANRGIFITTSDFTKSAKDYDAPGFKIILIDGKRLAQLMIDHNVGVSTVETYEIKRVDSDYFAENAEPS